ncbi:MAG: sulfite exporter TauE/SafE family protein [Rhodospirillales bacterium]|nr:sulfite exporter TauE/SafE family protein [Rhodospirillales bacterium]
MIPVLGMSVLGAAGLAGAVLFVGVLIGATGIGGVLLVPTLTFLGDVPVHLAVASCNFSYLFTGLVGTALYARKGSISWDMGLWLALGAMPGAYLGAFILPHVPGNVLLALIALLIVFSGLNAVLRAEDGASTRETLNRSALAAIGVVVGVGSALSGTGGPLVLVPILLWLKMPAIVAIGLSQTVMVPIALFATAGNVIHGRVDFVLGGALAAIMMIGAFAGADISHRLPAAQLKRVVAVLLIGVGAMMLARIGIGA